MRFPIYAKILFWFFLNLVALAIPAWLLFGAQFRPGLDSLLAGRAGDHIQAVSDLITAELHASDRSKWDEVLKRFGDAYHVRFYLFRNTGTQVAGDHITLPPAVQSRLTERPVAALLPQQNPPPPPDPAPFNNAQAAPPRPGEPPRPAEPLPPGQDYALGAYDRPLGANDHPPEENDQPPGANPQGAPRKGPHPKSMLRTSNPTRYWVFVRIPGARPDPGQPPEPSTLITESETINGGGLFFDPVPWLELAGGAFLISALLWLPLVRGITRSVMQMTVATGQIAEGRFDVRVAGRRRRDELGSLAAAINRMAERLAGFVGGQKRFLGDIAHELCSPLARAQMALAVLEQRADETQETQHAYIADVQEEIELMSSLVNELLSFSKASLGMQIKPQPVDLRPLVEKVIGREASGNPGVQAGIPENLRVMADPELLQRSLANLIRNAIHYAGHAGPIEITAAKIPGNKVTLTVADHGPGVPAEALAQVFDLFYRVDPSRARETGGAGLGLAIVKTCVESCGGTVTALNRTPSGLEVTITLPSA